MIQSTRGYKGLYQFCNVRREILWVRLRARNADLIMIVTSCFVGGAMAMLSYCLWIYEYKTVQWYEIAFLGVAGLILFYLSIAMAVYRLRADKKEYRKEQREYEELTKTAFRGD